MPATATVATTVLSYFSPTKSPFYSVTSFCAVALVLLTNVDKFIILYLPIVAVTLICTVLSFNSTPEFTAEEYNNQIKFSRSLGISVGILCLASHGRFFEMPDEPTTADSALFWIGYIAGSAQSFLFLLYVFIFHNYASKQRGVNLVQLSLIVSTYLIASTATNILFGTSDFSTNQNVIVVTLYGLWALSAAFIGRYLVQNFRLAAPRDAVSIQSLPD